MIRGASAPRLRPFFAHLPPCLARLLRLDARKPDSAKRRRNNGGKGAKSGVETAVYDPSIRMLQPWRSRPIVARHNPGAEQYTRCFDEIHKAVRKVHPTIFFAGPEGTGYTDYLIDVSTSPPCFCACCCPPLASSRLHSCHLLLQCLCP